MHSTRRRKKEAFVAWVIAAKHSKLSRLFTKISQVSYLSKNMLMMKKIKCYDTNDDEKDIFAGMGHLRVWMKKLSVRGAFSKRLSLNQQTIH